ncbi:hypothetical protein LTR47_011826 [Exophiala xenobiotica]|nr:hypothetical protein LTR41_011129 [Exophiala xenobiotica]KAK5215108.1 hypothetical protein LTR72_011813 [Exophiala xenobiotica]KAK5217835.1 hypothetical protein LTR47_011826 [Exophiala xenobiotica]KAK5242050.1 hypothetical protein LTS06_011765 [Exophiala xenobiotica]KAK5354364.1 hypothetical protein LTR11_011860 [Exophiala xenobiotica]
MNNNTCELGSPFTSSTLSTALFPSAAASGDPVSAEPPPESSAGRPGPSDACSVEQAPPIRESTSNFDVTDWFEIDVASSPSESKMPHQPAAAQNESFEAEMTDGEPPKKKHKLSQQPSTLEDQNPSQDTVPPSAPGKASKSEISTQSPDTPTPHADLANGTEVFLLDEQGNSVACSETVQPLGLHTLPVNRVNLSSLRNLDNPARFQAPCIFRALGRCPLDAAGGKWAYKIIPQNAIQPARRINLCILSPSELRTWPTHADSALDASEEKDKIRAFFKGKDLPSPRKHEINGFTRLLWRVDRVNMSMPKYETRMCVVFQAE